MSAQVQVFGDLKQVENAAEIVQALKPRLSLAFTMQLGQARHQALVAAFIRASELVQAIADAEFHHIHADEVSPQQDAGNALLLCLAKAIAASWDSSFVAPLPEHDGFNAQLDLLASAGSITTKQAEGYAFYALYPESYIAAARRSGLGPDTVVIGIRSIGVGLAALVAAGLGAPPAQTVRPRGHPFDRRLTVGTRLAQRLLAGQGAIAIVDEGPGLSGSSFNGVADWLVERGVAESRIHFFPSHLGSLGHAAQPAHRQRWEKACKHFVDFGALMLRAEDPAHRLQTWVAAAVDDSMVDMRDMSGGAWRDMAPREQNIPADPAMEKLKYLFTGEKRKWLAKFSGNGDSGERKLRLAQALGQRGFLPQPAVSVGGFLVLPWMEGENGANTPVPRERLLDYLAFRAGLPAPSQGASLEELSEAAIYNIGQRHGDSAVAATRAALGEWRDLSPVPCCTDNRMHRWEWVCNQGQWFKFDSLDHHAAHDLVGCQDIAWDIAGASVELDLVRDERVSLVSCLEKRLGRVFESRWIAFHELCYLGFQIGLWTMARDRNNEQEAVRIDTQLSRYDGRLEELGIIRPCPEP